MIVAVPKEIFPEENRVALIPATVSTLKKAGMTVIVEADAGKGAHQSDDAYREAGAEIETDPKALYSKADVLLKVRPLAARPDVKIDEIDLIGSKTTVIGMMDAYFNLDTVERLSASKITSFAMEFVPRISRAQSMDCLSSMAAIAGYRSIITAAAELPKYFPMLMTAAGTTPPCKVFVIGAGVAGLMAIATAKRMGAVVEAYDTRTAVKEQVESVGAQFVDLELEAGNSEGSGGYARSQSEDFYKRQQEAMSHYISQADIVVTTAAIPGKIAPLLVTDEMVQQMKPGSVIVDLATERGGNVEGSQKNKKVTRHGVTVLGYIDHPSRLSEHASQLYSKNISNFLLNLTDDGKLKLENSNDEIIQESMVTHQGKIIHSGILKALEEEVPAQSAA